MYLSLIVTADLKHGHMDQRTTSATRTIGLNAALAEEWEGGGDTYHAPGGGRCRLARRSCCNAAVSSSPGLKCRHPPPPQPPHRARHGVAPAESKPAFSSGHWRRQCTHVTCFVPNKHRHEVLPNVDTAIKNILNKNSPICQS